MITAASFAAKIGAKRTRYGTWAARCPICQGERAVTISADESGRPVVQNICRCGEHSVRDALVNEVEGVAFDEVLLSRELRKRKPEDAEQPSAKRRRKRTGNGTARPGATSDWASQCTLLHSGLIDGANPENLRVILHREPAWQGVLAYNEFSLRVVIRRELPRPDDMPLRQALLPRDLSDVDLTQALQWFYANKVSKLNRDTLRDALIAFAHENAFHPVKEFFDQIGKGDEPAMVPSTINDHRIDPDLPEPDALSMLLTLGFGADDTAINRAISRAFVISMARRVYHPGCQHDHLLVLIGGQGISKSTGLALLVGSDWFTDHMPDLHSKDALIQLHGKLLIEWGEMDALKRAEISRVKRFITTRIDSFRPPYGRANVNVPRTCCFAGSTNIDDFIDDPTGARRFWPVEVEQADRDWIVANRELIWRLAVEAEAVGEDSWITNTELQRQERELQEDAQQHDAWEDAVMNYVADWTTAGVRLADVLTNGLSIAVRDQHSGHFQRVAAILRRNKWQRVKSRPRGEGRARRWLPKGSR